MSHSTSAKLAWVFGACFLILSCSFLESAVSQETVAQGGAGAAQTAEDSRVQKTLALRSVRMELETAFPGKDPSRILIDIDAEGNQRIEMALPEPEGSVPGDSPEANILEIFVIGGESYTRMGKEGQAESAPEQADALRRILNNPTGPGMWLMILPRDALTSAGKEETGGFQATRYSVDGSVEEGSIRGEIWVDEQTKALVGAHLSISDSLFSAEGSGTGGSVSITLTVEKAEVNPITLP
jgi:hypothetical protein